jgi:hypothetical protein
MGRTPASVAPQLSSCDRGSGSSSGAHARFSSSNRSGLVRASRGARDPARTDGRQLLAALPTARRAAPGMPFLFKLRAPANAIAGFGYFASFSVLPDWLAWDTFGEANGVANLAVLRAPAADPRGREHRARSSRVHRLLADRGGEVLPAGAIGGNADRARAECLSSPRSARGPRSGRSCWPGDGSGQVETADSPAHAASRRSPISACTTCVARCESILRRRRSR